jgi:hypothetical protein
MGTNGAEASVPVAAPENGDPLISSGFDAGEGTRTLTPPRGDT